MKEPTTYSRFEGFWKNHNKEIENFSSSD